MKKVSSWKGKELGVVINIGKINSNLSFPNNQVDTKLLKELKSAFKFEKKSKFLQNKIHAVLRWKQTGPFLSFLPSPSSFFPSFTLLSSFCKLLTLHVE